MKIHEIINYLGMFSWILSGLCLSFIAHKYYLKQGILSSIGANLDKKDMRLVKAAAILFTSGIILFVIAALFK